MTPHLWLLLGLGSGLVSGYPWGAWVRRRKLERAGRDGYRTGYEDGHDDGWDARGEWQWDRERDDTLAIGSALAMVPRPGSAGVTGRAEPERGPGSDWQERMAAELAPEALALDVPEPGHGAQGDPATASLVVHETAGLGHPSPYAGSLTPAQRRRDKHKQRGQWAPLEPGHWYAQQLHGLADWQAEWHADVAAFDVWLPGWAESYRASLVPLWTRFEQMVEA